jgi:hypothetical protein
MSRSLELHELLGQYMMYDDLSAGALIRNKGILIFTMSRMAMETTQSNVYHETIFCE